MRRAGLLISCFAIILWGCAQPAPEAPQTEFKAVATTQDIMESLVAHMAQDIWDAVRIEIDAKGTHEYKPQNREEWQEVAYAARGLAEASTLMMYEGRVEDHGDWEKYVRELTDSSLASAKAADDQDEDKLLETGGTIYEVCTKCHEQYRDKVALKRTGGKAPEAPATPPPGAAPAGEKK